ncbi:hypothetical protein VTK26DRAFT_4078 [Humicola hyalothermophila]
MSDDTRWYYEGSRTRQPQSRPCNDVPSPLHIKKGSTHGKAHRVRRGSYQCNPAGDKSASDMDSPPEQLKFGRPLTVPKRRGDRSAYASFGHEYDRRSEGHAHARAITPLAGLASPKRRRSTAFVPPLQRGMPASYPCRQPGRTGLILPNRVHPRQDLNGSGGLENVPGAVSPAPPA